MYLVLGGRGSLVPDSHTTSPPPTTLHRGRPLVQIKRPYYSKGGRILDWCLLSTVTTLRVTVGGLWTDKGVIGGASLIGLFDTP